MGDIYEHVVKFIITLTNYSFLFEQQEHEPANTSGSWGLEPNDVILKALKYFLVIK